MGRSTRGAVKRLTTLAFEADERREVRLRTLQLLSARIRSDQIDEERESRLEVNRRWSEHTFLCEAEDRRSERLTVSRERYSRSTGAPNGDFRPEFHDAPRPELQIP